VYDLFGKYSNVFLVKHSKCRTDFLTRVKVNEQLKRTAKETGKTVPLASIKRQVI
jgi:hypothetical protein